RFSCPAVIAPPHQPLPLHQNRRIRTAVSEPPFQRGPQFGIASEQAQSATAMHSISTRAPAASAVAPNAERAGLGTGKNVAYTVFIAGHSFMSARNTVHF